MTTTPKITLKLTIAAFSMLLAFSCSNSKDSKDQAENANEEKFNNEGEKEADRLVDAYAMNLYEIRASESAASRASTAEVKKLAAMMVESHTKMNTEIQQLAGIKSITLPTDLADDKKRKLDNLNEKTGLDFDKEYTDQMESGHDDAIRECEKASEHSDDSEIKAWAGRALPEIRSHKDMITSTKNMLKDMKDNARDGHDNTMDKHDHVDGHDHHDAKHK
jgi:putative membrane protein